jgi:hypothetical protein
MPYYMEFSPAIGMHAGYLPGYPASHGCVRMPRDLAARFFERVNIRTPVTVTGSTQNLASVSKGHPTFSIEIFCLHLCGERTYGYNRPFLRRIRSRDEY